MQESFIKLVPLSKSDIPFLNSIRNDWENKKMTMGIRFPITFEGDMVWYDSINNDRSNKNIFFAIKKQDTSDTIGLVQLNNIDWINRNAFVGIQILKTETGKGVGYIALDLIVHYAFNILNLNKILAHVVAYNNASLNLFKKCKFEQEGVLKSHIYYDNKYHDLVVLSRFKE